MSQDLDRQLTEMKLKLTKAKVLRANYQALRMMLRWERDNADAWQSWAEKLERACTNILQDTLADSAEIRRYLEKVVDSKPKNVQ